MLLLLPDLKPRGLSPLGLREHVIFEACSNLRDAGISEPALLRKLEAWRGLMLLNLLMSCGGLMLLFVGGL